MKIETGKMTLLPPAKNVCQECATDHPPGLPHNNQSLYYQMKFHMEHGRFPSWDDAMAHCESQVKAIWIEELKKLGQEV